MGNSESEYSKVEGAKSEDGDVEYSTEKNSAQRNAASTGSEQESSGWFDCICGWSNEDDSEPKPGIKPTYIRRHSELMRLKIENPKKYKAVMDAKRRQSRRKLSTSGTL